MGLFGNREDPPLRVEEEEMVSLVDRGSDSHLHSRPRSKIAHTTLSIKGMHCSACSTSIESAIRALPGVISAQVALLSESAQVTYNLEILSPSTLVETIEDTGFEARIVSTSLDAAVEPECLKIQITGMHCSACSTAVESALNSLPGVRKASVSLALHMAEVTVDTTQTTEAELTTAIEDAGFDAELVGKNESNVVQLKIDGMTCSACSSAVEAALSAAPGVSEAAVNLIAGVAEVRFDPSTTGPRYLITAIEDAGFDASVMTKDRMDFADRNKEDTEKWRRQLVLSTAFTIPVFCIAMVFPMLGLFGFLYTTMLFGFPLNELLKWGLVTPVQFVIGKRFHVGAYKALKARRANMDVLISLGTNASYFYSVISILHHHFQEHHEHMAYRPTDFFETSAMLITLVLFGKYLESKAKGKTSEAIVKLCQLAPPTALLIDKDDSLQGGQGNSQDNDKSSNNHSDNREYEVSTSLVHRGDLLKVLPGSRIPVDAVVVEGTSYVDESMLTGESLPVRKEAESSVYGGTVNGGGVLIVKASKVGGDTALSQIVRLVEAAQLSKAPIQKFADRVSEIFVPVVVGISLFTFCMWWISGSAGWYPRTWLPQGHSVFLFAFMFGIAVLVIACPCALGLATPTAVMVGTGVAASNGILIKGGDALERSVAVTTVVFDKTGTLTLGKPHVVDFRVMTIPGSDAVVADDMIRLAAAVEGYSEHPIAAAILQFADAYIAGNWFPGQKPTTSSPGLFDKTRSPRANGSNNSMRSPRVASSPTAAANAFRLNDDDDGDGVASSPGGSRNNNSNSTNSAHRLPAKDVSVTVGEGIQGWVAVPSTWGSASVLATLQQHIGSSSSPTSPTTMSSTPTSPTAIAQQRLNTEVLVSVGNKRLMADAGVVLSPSAEEYMREMESRACSCVLVAVHTALIGIIAVTDPIKPEARGVVSALHQMGMHTVLLTGDNWRTARAIADQLGISSVEAEVLPAGKVATVVELQQNGRVKVAMVGDGINDSPALAQADVGVAVGSGADVAIEAADVVLMRSDLEDVLMAFDLCRKTFNRIKWNYAWAMGYNIVMIPVAAGCLYPSLHFKLPPWIAGACMAASSLSVVASSLLLRRYQRPKGVLRDLVILKR